MPKANTGFASVERPAARVDQARQAAQPMRRSVAGQVEYWATLGGIVAHSGLLARFIAVEDDGCLAQRVRDVVGSKRSKVGHTANKKEACATPMRHIGTGQRPLSHGDQ